jgi:hypothetical protein
MLAANAIIGQTANRFVQDIETALKAVKWKDRTVCEYSIENLEHAEVIGCLAASVLNQHFSDSTKYPIPLNAVYIHEVEQERRLSQLLDERSYSISVPATEQEDPYLQCAAIDLIEGEQNYTIRIRKGKTNNFPQVPTSQQIRYLDELARMEKRDSFCSNALMVCVIAIVVMSAMSSE